MAATTAWHAALVVAADVLVDESPADRAQPLIVGALVGAAVGALLFGAGFRLIVGRNLDGKKRSGLMAAAAFVGIGAGFVVGALVGSLFR
jgi:hypothetical protein